MILTITIARTARTKGVDMFPTTDTPVEMFPHTDGILDMFPHTGDIHNGVSGQVGFLASQRVDGKLVLPEAVKVLAQKAASGS